MPQADRVRVTIEMSREFLSLLNGLYQLKGLGSHREDYRKHTAADVLAVIVLHEGRGAPEEQTHADTPIEWRNEIEPVCAERRWRDAETKEWRTTK